MWGVCRYEVYRYLGEEGYIYHISYVYTYIYIYLTRRERERGGGFGMHAERKKSDDRQHPGNLEFSGGNQSTRLRPQCGSWRLQRLQGFDIYIYIFFDFFWKGLSIHFTLLYLTLLIRPCHHHHHQ